MFINDLVGLNLADAGAAWIFTPPRSDVVKAAESLKKIRELPISRLYLGHFGIWNNPTEVIQGALNRIQRLMDIGDQCVNEGKPEEIELRILDLLKLEAEKIGAVRGTEGLYRYVSGPHLGGNFAKYYLSLKR